MTKALSCRKSVTVITGAERKQRSKELYLRGVFLGRKELLKWRKAALFGQEASEYLAFRGGKYHNGILYSILGSDSAET